jgi:hypothetical protein
MLRMRLVRISVETGSPGSSTMLGLDGRFSIACYSLTHINWEYIAVH